MHFFTIVKNIQIQAGHERHLQEIHPWSTIGRIDSLNFDDLALANFVSKGVSKSCSVPKSGLILNPKSSITLDLTLDKKDLDKKDQENVLNMLGQNEKVFLCLNFIDLTVALDLGDVEVRQEGSLRF